MVRSKLPPMFSVLFELRAPNAGKRQVLALWVTAPKNECGSVPKWPQFSLNRTPDLTKRASRTQPFGASQVSTHRRVCFCMKRFGSFLFHLLCAAMAQLEQELLEFGYSAGLCFRCDRHSQSPATWCDRTREAARSSCCSAGYGHTFHGHD